MSILLHYITFANLQTFFLCLRNTLKTDNISLARLEDTCTTAAWGGWRVFLNPTRRCTEIKPLWQRMQEQSFCGTRKAYTTKRTACRLEMWTLRIKRNTASINSTVEWVCMFAPKTWVSGELRPFSAMYWSAGADVNVLTSLFGGPRAKWLLPLRAALFFSCESGMHLFHYPEKRPSLSGKALAMDSFCLLFTDMLGQHEVSFLKLLCSCLLILGWATLFWYAKETKTGSSTMVCSQLFFCNRRCWIFSLWLAHILILITFRGTSIPIPFDPFSYLDRQNAVGNARTRRVATPEFSLLRS